MSRLTCNLRNIKRPIIGIIPNKRVVKDELNVEIPIRTYTRIKKDCNVFAVIDNKEYIIPTESDFKRFLELSKNFFQEHTKIQEIPEEIVTPIEQPVTEEATNISNEEAITPVETEESVNEEIEYENNTDNNQNYSRRKNKNRR